MITKLKPQNFELTSGNDKVLNFVHRNEDGNIVDITGATISWALANSQKAKSRIIFYTTPVNVTIVNAVKGEYRVDIQAGDTEPLTGRDYYHEVRITSAGGVVHTAAFGTVTVRRNVIDT